MTKYTLTNLGTGEVFTFGKMYEAVEFTGRSDNYIRACAKSGMTLYDREKNRWKILITTTRKEAVRFCTQQLCCSCKNFAGGCEWSERFEPVEGWTATPTILNSAERYIESYHITACPKYAEG